jgi:hypothetical protein
MEAEREPGTLIDGRYRVVRDDDEGVYAVDLRDGARVLIPHPALQRHEGQFVDVMFREADTRAVAALAHPSIVRVRAVAPRLVFDEPPPIWAPSSAPHTEDLVACALLMLDAMAHLHAAGLTGVSVVPENARFHRPEGAWRLALIHPPLPPIERWGLIFPNCAARNWDDEVIRDVASIGPLIARLQMREIEAPRLLLFLRTRRPSRRQESLHCVPARGRLPRAGLPRPVPWRPLGGTRRPRPRPRDRPVGDASHDARLRTGGRR